MSKLTYQQICENAAAEISRLIEQGTAPWMQPLKPGASTSPLNAKTGKPYRGLNPIWLCLACQPDPRWLTYRQAQALGGQVRRGEKSHTLFFWQFAHRRARRDESGHIVRDEHGETVWVRHDNPRPLVRTFRVFNATQIDHLPPAPWATTPVNPFAVRIRPMAGPIHSVVCWTT